MVVVKIKFKRLQRRLKQRCHTRSIAFEAVSRIKMGSTTLLVKTLRLYTLICCAGLDQVTVILSILDNCEKFVSFPNKGKHNEKLNLNLID